MIKPLIIGIALCSQLWGFQPYLLYSNAIQTPFLNLDAGAGTSISYGPIEFIGKLFFIENTWNNP